MKWWMMLPLLGVSIWNFDKDEVNKEPAGFEFATTGKTPPGKWAVVKDGDNKVLAQLDKDSTGGRYALAVVKDASYKNVRLSVKAKAISGEEDQAAGLVWRYQDCDNYYVARLNVLENNVRLYSVVKGKRIQFAGKENVKLQRETWTTLKIEQQGESIAVFLDGEKLFAAQDKTFEGAGKVGVWTKADSVTDFDDLTAEELK